MAELPIVMKQLNNQGQYDTLYPQTTPEQAGAVPVTRTINGMPLTEDIVIDLSELDGYTKEETLTAATAQMYGLSSSAVPDDVFANIAESINGLESQTMMVKLREYTVPNNTPSYNLDLSGLNLSSYDKLRIYITVPFTSSDFYSDIQGRINNITTTDSYQYITPSSLNPLEENSIYLGGYVLQGYFILELFPFGNYLGYTANGSYVAVGSRLTGVWLQGYNNSSSNNITAISFYSNNDARPIPANMAITLYGINLP